MALNQYIRADMYHPEDRDEILSGEIDEAKEKVMEKYPDINWDMTDCFDEFEEKYDRIVYSDDDVANLQDAIDVLEDYVFTETDLTDDDKFNDLQQYILARAWCEEECPGDDVELAAKKWQEADSDHREDFLGRCNGNLISISAETASELYETCKNNSWDDLRLKYNMEFTGHLWGELNDAEKRKDFNERFIAAYDSWKKDASAKYPHLVYVAYW